MDYTVFAEDAQVAVAQAVEEAARLGASTVRPEHLRLALLRLGYERLRDTLREGEPPDGAYRLPLDDSLTRLLEAAAAPATPEQPVTTTALEALVAPDGK